MSEGNKKYDWQKMEISPHNEAEILEQIEFLEKMLENDPECLVIPLEEQLAMHEELIRLVKMWTSAITEDINKRAEAARQAEQQAAKRAARQADPWFQLQQGSHMFCIHLWLLFGLCLFSLPMAVDLSKNFPSMFPMWCIMTVGSLAWAIWASKVPEE